MGLDRDEELRSIIFIFDKHKNMCTNAHFQVHCFFNRGKIRSHLKNRILVQVQGGTDFQPADILKYFEELEFAPNTEIGTIGLFGMVSKCSFSNQPSV